MKKGLTKYFRTPKAAASFYWMGQLASTRGSRGDPVSVFFRYQYFRRTMGLGGFAQELQLGLVAGIKYWYPKGGRWSEGGLHRNKKGRNIPEFLGQEE